MILNNVFSKMVCNYVKKTPTQSHKGHKECCFSNVIAAVRPSASQLFFHILNTFAIIFYFNIFLPNLRQWKLFIISVPNFSTSATTTSCDSPYHLA